MNKDELIQAIEKMSVLELNELVKALEEKFGVSAANVTTVTAPAAGQTTGEEAEAAEEKDSFNVVLKDAGQQKIQVIKIIREATGKGLKEAKDLTDKTPVVIKEGIKKAEAEELKKKLEEVGGAVELK